MRELASGRSLGMIRSIHVFAVWIALSASASAAFTESDFATAALQPATNARIPDSIWFEDDSGRTLHFPEALAGHPALLLPVDFNCRTLCGPALTIASAALAETGLRAGEDFRLLVIGFDPRDSTADAHAFVAARIGDPAI